MNTSSTAHSKRLAVLRQRVIDARDFGDPWRYFHDQLAADPGFLALGEPARDARIVAALEAAASHALRAPAKASEVTMVCLADEGFWHGYVEVGGAAGIFFYFDTPALGLLGLSQSFETPDIFLLRISLAKTVGEGPLFPGRRGKS